MLFSFARYRFWLRKGQYRWTLLKYISWLVCQQWHLKWHQDPQDVDSLSWGHSICGLIEEQALMIKFPVPKFHPRAKETRKFFIEIEVLHGKFG